MLADSHLFIKTKQKNCVFHLHLCVTTASHVCLLPVCILFRCKSHEAKLSVCALFFCFHFFTICSSLMLYSLALSSSDEVYFWGELHSAVLILCLCSAGYGCKLEALLHSSNQLLVVDFCEWLWRALCSRHAVVCHGYVMWPQWYSPFSTSSCILKLCLTNNHNCVGDLFLNVRCVADFLPPVIAIISSVISECQTYAFCCYF